MDDQKQENREEKKNKFLCPNDGEVSQDDVVFLCNTCDSSEVKEVDGMFICPQCFSIKHPFECRICGSKDVKMKKIKQ